VSDKNILEKAIQKAIDGGWDSEGWDARALTIDCLSTLGGWHTSQIIFNHDFAKALWGDEGTTIQGLRCSKEEGVYKFWQYHLQQMVLTEDPIKYLGDNI